ncbi:MAG: transglutaminase family protein [Verrucomicrobium sp.]|nr:transglutaminase family protein [Verrucomicrobium sp.]
MTTLAQVGRAVDAALARSGVAVTVGGEPTFIAADHRHAEWNFDALGPEKLAYGRRFAAALRRKLAPGCLVTHTMGKQYPGEPLPRWAIGLHWRKDGKPLLPGKGIAYRLDRAGLQKPEAAARLARALPALLKLKAKPLPAFENPPGKKPAGWVLPLDGGAGAWTSPAWKLPGPCLLWPGQSPLGLRLPLGELPPETPRRALTVETRDGELSVFLPPVEKLEDYLDLLRAVRAAAGGEKLLLEGYAPPSGEELVRLNVIADPGVLEVNLPPAALQAEADRFIDALYAAAPACGLRPWKYQFTGRKIGTGGGAHILLGGPKAEESPFFQRPRLLPSFVRFLQRHPSLSYLFTGLFTGPSSQAPRVDESAYEVPYELEIALRGVEAMRPPVDKPLLDLMLRNLLMDTVGNTHRAEISVDKLWNPFAPNGCLGLVEFRAFEMPPEPAMLRAAVTLLRALAAAFLARPYGLPLKRWGEALHDRYALPVFLKRDFQEVLAFLQRAGFALEWEHFAPWFEFRFPVIGRLAHAGRAIEFRQAIEPWPVLGEQPAGGGTSRIVDASTDRLQVRVPDAAWARRFRLLAAGRPVSLQADPEGEALLGAVRYRMFHSLPSLQPHLPAQSPLLFEWVEAATGRTVAACSLLNWRPGEQPYDGLPQTDRAALARVAERFVPAPKALGRVHPAAGKPARCGRYTTDLRLS